MGRGALVDCPNGALLDCPKSALVDGPDRALVDCPKRALVGGLKVALATAGAVCVWVWLGASVTRAGDLACSFPASGAGPPPAASSSL
mmetsp:Transcript_141731/g.317474  ORF Transcript_141731/g.317474 Transcript_141731/m.317474 type:complete len:88 (+) Transcript_141731:565-828(+)